MDPTFTSRASGASRSPRPAFTVVGMALAVGLLATACGGSDPAAPPTSSTTEVPTTSTTVLPTPTTEAPGPEVEIEAVYRAFWDATIEAGNPPDPNAAVLTQVATGSALAELEEGLRALYEVGQAVRLPTSSVSGLSDLQVSVSGDSGIVAACVVDDAVIFDRASGMTLNDRVLSGWAEATVVRTPDGWRVSATTIGDQVEGMGGCTS